MNKSDLIRRIASRYADLYERDAERLVSAVLNRIEEGLQTGDRVELRGFGTFTVKERAARIGRNPRTGKPVPIDAKRTLYFRTGKELRGRLNVSGESSDTDRSMVSVRQSTGVSDLASFN